MSNTSPVITVDSNNIGTKSATFDFSFTVTDADEDSISGVIKIDDTPVFILNEIELNEENIITIQDTALESLSQGSHTITIQVTDGTDTVTQNISFNRAATIFMDRKATISKQNLVDLTSGILEEIVSLMGDGSGGLDLSNYYTKTQVDNLISLIPTFDIEVVQSLPTENISQSTVYLLTSASALSQNSYIEYIYVNNNWEKLGEGTVDLSGYYTSTQVNSLVNALNANLAQNYSNSSTYSVGDFVIYENQLYKCKTAISSGESFNSSKWDSTSLENELGELGELGDKNVQSNWNENDSTSDSYIQNKPVLGSAALKGVVTTISNSSDLPTSEAVKNYVDNSIDNSGEENVQADWNESDSSSDAFIKNKPSIVSSIDTSSALPTSNAVKEYVDNHSSGGSGQTENATQVDWEEDDPTSDAYIQNKPVTNDILYDETETERQIGWYRYSDGTMKPVYQRIFDIGTNHKVQSENLPSSVTSKLDGPITILTGRIYICDTNGSVYVTQPVELNTNSNNTYHVRCLATWDGSASRYVRILLQYIKQNDTAS